MRNSMGAGGELMNKFMGFNDPPPLFHCTAEQREKILAAQKEVLAAWPEVIFAYAYGSFLEDLPFHDIDVGVYVTAEDEQRAASLALDLTLAFEAAIKHLFKQGVQLAAAEGHGNESPCPHCFPVDVRVLNWAPVSFCYHVLRGRLLFCRDEDIRARWAEWVISRYLDSKPLRHRALKEAMLSWS